MSSAASLPVQQKHPDHDGRQRHPDPRVERAVLPHLRDVQEDVAGHEGRDAPAAHAGEQPSLALEVGAIESRQAPAAASAGSRRAPAGRQRARVGQNRQ